MRDRGLLLWIALVAAGIVAVLGVAALLADDAKGETVPAGEWAQSVCGSIGVWRGELEAIVEDIRTPTSAGTGSEEPQSETPQGRTGLVRQGLERAVQATDTLVEGVENAGVPDTEQGEEAAQQISEWADAAKDALEDADENLDEEADSLEESLETYAESVAAMARVLALGVEELAEVVRLDPALGAALRDASTCQELREEES